MVPYRVFSVRRCLFPRATSVLVEVRGDICPEGFLNADSVEMQWSV